MAFLLELSSFSSQKEQEFSGKALLCLSNLLSGGLSSVRCSKASCLQVEEVFDAGPLRESEPEPGYG